MDHVSFVYLDDGLGSLPDNYSTQAANIIQRKDHGSSGFVVNEDKSRWSPRQIDEWLGLIINTILMWFQVPDMKVAKLKNDIRLCHSRRLRNVSEFSQDCRIGKFYLPCGRADCSITH